MDLSKEAMSAVNHAILGQAVNDPELTHMASIVSQIADILKCDPASARTGFLNDLMDLNADLLSQTEKKKVIDMQTQKLNELEEAKSLIRKQISHAKAHITKAEIARLKSKVESLNSKHLTLTSSMKALRTKLDAIGYSEDISEMRFKKKKVHAALLEREISDLAKDVNQYNGVDASDEAFRTKISEMRIRIENFSSLYDI